MRGTFSTSSITTNYTCNPFTKWQRRQEANTSLPTSTARAVVRFPDFCSSWQNRTMRLGHAHNAPVWPPLSYLDICIYLSPFSSYRSLQGAAWASPWKNTRPNMVMGSLLASFLAFKLQVHINNIPSCLLRTFLIHSFYRWIGLCTKQQHGQVPCSPVRLQRCQ